MLLIKRMLWIMGIGLIAVTAWAEETVRLTIGEWPPYMSKELKHYGVVTRIITEAFAAQGMKVEYGFFPWARSYDLSKEGEWDGTGVWGTDPKREVYFHYSDLVVKDALTFFHLKSYPFAWTSMNDLKGVPIGGTLEYNYGEEFRSAEQQGVIKVQYVPKDEMNLSKILEGRIKIFPVETDVGYDLLQKNFKPAEVALFTHHPKYLRQVTYHLLLSKKVERSPRLLQAFNAGLKQLQDSGKTDQYWAESRRGEYKAK